MDLEDKNVKKREKMGRLDRREKEGMRMEDEYKVERFFSSFLCLTYLFSDILY